MALIANQKQKKSSQKTTLADARSSKSAQLAKEKRRREKRKKRAETKEQEKYNPMLGYDKNTDKTPKVDYVTAFRQFQQFKRCRSILESLENNENPFLNHLKKLNRGRKDNNPFELSSVQHRYFEHKVEGCKNMQSFSGELYTAGHERYRKRFYETTPESKEAKNLAQSWPLKEKMRHLKFKHTKLRVNIAIESSYIQKIFNRKIQNYQGMLSYINRNTDIDFSQRTREEINMYQDFINDFEAILAGNILIDTDYIAELTAQYQQKQQDIVRFLQQNNSAEAFTTLAPFAFADDALARGFYDQRYYQRISLAIYNLIGCAMGAACDENSEIITQNCFGNLQASELACGQNVQDFYLSTYFSPNQLNDALPLVDYYLDNYAEF